MTTANIDNSQRDRGKSRGNGVTSSSFAIVVFANYVLLNPLIVPRNAADTARNILAHQTQFRIALICFITYGIGAIVLAQRALRHPQTNQSLLALAGALFRLVFAMSWLFAPINVWRASIARRRHVT